MGNLICRRRNVKMFELNEESFLKKYMLHTRYGVCLDPNAVHLPSKYEPWIELV